ncbi:hypothetical protein FHS96_000876 [Sphingomonas zeicaulis]|uniref:hypothetical protein n=1 Tax=Sphingomonas zeicaulis TaxID=1632740 RepID=UPI003D1EC190
MKVLIPLVTLLLVGACADDAADNVADQLENAADQSGNIAAPILDNAADDIRDGSVDPAGDAQNAMSVAGNAQAEQQVPPPAVQAQPHQPGDPVPPPKTRGEPD